MWLDPQLVGFPVGLVILMSVIGAIKANPGMTLGLIVGLFLAVLAIGVSVAVGIDEGSIIVLVVTVAFGCGVVLVAIGVAIRWWIG